MADRNLELALRIKADTAQAVNELRKVEKQIGGLATTSKKSTAAAGASDAVRRATDQATQLAKADAGIRRTTESLSRLDKVANNAGKGLGRAFEAIARGNGAGASDALATGAARAATSLGGLGFALGGVVALLAIYAKAVFDSYQEQQLFERALITSGNIIGSTAGQLAAARDEAGSLTGRFGDAATSVAKLASSGEVAADTLAAASSAALALSELTGASIEDTTAKIIALAKAPSEQLAELNAQYNFLTFEVYEHVKSLEAQGRAEDAARIAIEEFGRVHEERVAEALERAGTLERGWIRIKQEIRGAWQEIKNIGRDDTPFRLLEVQRKLAAADVSRRKLIEGGAAEASIRFVENEQLRLLEEYKQLSIEAGKERADAEAEAAKQQLETNAIAAAGRQGAALAQDRAIAKAKELKQLESDLAALRAKGVDSVDGMSLADVEAKRRAQIEDRFKVREPRTPRTPKGTDPNAAAQRELDNLRQQTALLGELEDGERKASEAARVRYEIQEGAFRSASPALQEQLQTAAAELDLERLKIDAAKQLVDVKLRTMALQGRSAESELARTTAELERLRVKLLELGKLGEAADVAKLMNLEQAKSQLTSLQRDLDTFYNRVSAAEQRVNIDRESGLISSVEAQRRLLEIRQQEIAFLQQQIPLLEQQNALLKDPAVAESLEQMKLKLYELQQQGSLLETTFRNTFEFGLAGALEGLATGTLTLRQALVGLIQDVVSGMARLAAQQLASIATAKLMSVLFKGQGESTDVSAGASKLQTAALATGLAGGVVKFGADALSSAAKELAAAATLMIVANSLGGFAEGGYTGDGGKYQIAGFVHKGEGVLSAEEIRALGGPRGFYALRHAISHGYADGGLVGAPQAMAAPRYEISAGSPLGTLPTPELRMQLVNLFDVDEAIRRHFAGPKGDKTYLNMVGRNSRASRVGA